MVGKFLRMESRSRNKMEELRDIFWCVEVERKLRRITKVVREIIGPCVGERVQPCLKLKELALGLKMRREIWEGVLGKDISRFLANGREV